VPREQGEVRCRLRYQIGGGGGVGVGERAGRLRGGPSERRRGGAAAVLRPDARSLTRVWVLGGGALQTVAFVTFFPGSMARLSQVAGSATVVAALTVAQASGAHAFDGADAVALIIGLILAFVIIFAGLGWYSRRV
jgi:hypothetical protein